MRKKNILCTVGTQLPFDRLIKMLDEVAPEYSHYKIYAQIGDSSYNPVNFEYKNFLSSNEFNKVFSESDIVIAHAGMGSIISALSNNKPIFITPRLTLYNEHRNDHQSATFEKFGSITGCYGFINTNELRNLLSIKDLKAGVDSFENIKLCNKLLNLLS